MRKLLWIAALALAFPMVAGAQDTPKVELFGGYSYLRVSENVTLVNINPDVSPAVRPQPQGTVTTTSNPFSPLNLNGWNAAVQYNLNSWFGVVADFTGYYGSPTKTISGTPVTVDTNEYNYLFGPRFSYRKSERWTPFVHALFGGGHVHVKGSAPGFTPVTFTDNAFSMAVGGGLDLKVANHVAIRLVDADYLMTKFGDDHQNNFRYSAGLVFRF